MLADRVGRRVDLEVVERSSAFGTKLRDLKLMQSPELARKNSGSGRRVAGVRVDDVLDVVLEDRGCGPAGRTSRGCSRSVRSG